MKNKKVGIITMHRNVNYGANLQAFASCKYLNDLGYQASVIDFFPKDMDAENHLIPWLKMSWNNEPNKSIQRKIKLSIALGLSMGWKQKRLKAFFSFRNKYMNLTPYCYDVKQVVPFNFDAVICGSDQVWNPTITWGIKPIYFSEVPGVPLKISYAASIGKEKYDEESEKQAAKLIKNIDYCSVREESTKKYAEELSGKNIECVCDPVFLLDKSVYVDMCGNPIEKTPYLLLYSIVSNSEMTEIAKEYAKQKGLKLVEICASPSKSESHTQVCDAGPLEFLNYFNYADAVITNSFHGTAFSIVFEKHFYSVNNKNGGSRITNLLEKAGLDSRMVTLFEEIKDDVIDYSLVKNSMKEYIYSSKQFLQNALSAETKPVIHENCIGCGACKAVCGRDAINMVKNKEGFQVAVIDTKKCVNCGICEMACPSLCEQKTEEFNQEVYAFKALDDIRIESTSGGAYSALADVVLGENGTVYGVGWDDKYSVKHVKCTSAEDLKANRGVKYIQSDFSDTFKEVAKDLKDGKKVLVTGTPCQIASMKKFVEVKKLDASNLYLVDIICHGIPTPMFFRDYLGWLETKYNSKVREYHFRDKNISWRGHSCSVEFENGTKLNSNEDANSYMNTYYSNYLTRECCYNCKYTSVKRLGDVTISDYWGLENCLPEFEDKLGVSMVLVNTQKGSELFNACKGVKTAGDISAAKQPQLHAPCEKPTGRDEFWNEYYITDTENILKKHGGLGAGKNLKSYVYAVLKKLKT